MNGHKLETTASRPIDFTPPSRGDAAHSSISTPWTARNGKAHVEPNAARRWMWREARHFLSNPSATFGAAVLLVIVLSALLAPILCPGDPMEMVARPFLAPGENSAHALGTDSMGRDVLAGVVHGARVSLTISFAATFIGLTAGIAIGAVAGYFGGPADAALVKLIEVVQSIPSFILLIVLVAIAEPSTTTVTVAIAIVSWPAVARLARAECRAIREMDYVLAARSLGFGHMRIIFREILPNASPPLIAMSSVMVANAVLMESALSFIGLGDPNQISWGSMIGAGRDAIRIAWTPTVFPGLAIVSTVLAVNLIGDRLDDALDPRISGERQ